MDQLNTNLFEIGIQIGDEQDFYCENQRFSRWEAIFDGGCSHDQYLLNRSNDYEKYLRLKEDLQNQKHQLLQKNPLQSDCSQIDILQLIDKDVKRTFQEIDIFTQNHIQELLFDILSVWSMQNKNISYAQGMNDILGVLLLTYFDQTLLKPDTESRVYWLFTRLMEYHKKMFLSGRDSPILQRIKVFQNYYLKLLDIDLFRFMKFEELHLQVFLLRWMRCLLSREFDIEQVKFIWDHLFRSFILSDIFLDCICLGMILNIKDKILYEGTSMEGMKKLLNYPNKEDYPFIIQKAYNIESDINQIILAMIKLQQRTGITIDRCQTFISSDEMENKIGFFQSAQQAQKVQEFELEPSLTYKPQGVGIKSHDTYCGLSIFSYPMKKIRTATSFMLKSLYFRRSSENRRNIELRSYTK